MSIHTNFYLPPRFSSRQPGQQKVLTQLEELGLGGNDMPGLVKQGVITPQQGQVLSGVLNGDRYVDIASQMPGVHYRQVGALAREGLENIQAVEEA